MSTWFWLALLNVYFLVDGIIARLDGNVSTMNAVALVANSLGFLGCLIAMDNRSADER